MKFLTQTSTRRRFVRGAIWGAAALFASSNLACAQNAQPNSLPTKTRKPNVIVVLIDDMGYADLGFTGVKDFATPNIDALARDGVTCTNGYATAPVCSPSRAGFITGRYQTRFGHERNPFDTDDPKVGLPVEQKTIADVMKSNGYRTAALGKWHLGQAPHFQPMARGFDEWFGFLGGHHDYLPRKGETAPIKVMRNREEVEEKEYLTDALTREAVSFVDRNQKNPFFLYLAYNAPHAPLQAPAKYKKLIAGIEDPKRATYAAMMLAVDEGVGKLRAELKADNLEKDTLIFFWNDNGGATNNSSDNGILRETKGTMYEGGLRVPFSVTWPGHLPANRVCDQPVISLDIIPTTIAAADLKPIPGMPLDGLNIMDTLRTDAAPARERLYWRWNDGKFRAVREGRYKWVRLRDGESELYDLQSDIGETKNIATEKPELTAHLRAAYEAWDKDNIDPVFPARAKPTPKDGNKAQGKEQNDD